MPDLSVAQVVSERASGCLAFAHTREFKAASVHPDCAVCAGVVFTITEPALRPPSSAIWIAITATRDGQPIATDPDGYGWIGLSALCADGLTEDWGQALQEAIVDVVLH